MLILQSALHLASMAEFVGQEVDKAAKLVLTHCDANERDNSGDVNRAKLRLSSRHPLVCRHR